ncbi:unnamed protein product, partial [Brachionus calyciflorus]
KLLFELNKKQFLATKLFLEHSISCSQNLIYLGGDGGTGITRVILAIKFYFWFNNENTNIKIAAYTGTAANLIFGNTIHGTFKFQINHKERNYSNVTFNDIIDWEKVTHMIIDEVSMVSCKMLTDIDRSLRELKRSKQLFGGIHILFSADFFQLPPVASVPLYCNYDLENFNDNNINQAQENLYGRWLWLQINKVIFLDLQMRQKNDIDFANFLRRVKYGDCTKDDIKKIKEKIINKKTKIEYPIPTIVSSNKLKLQIINKTKQKLEIEMNTKIISIQAIDFIRNQNNYEKTNSQIKNLINVLDDNSKTKEPICILASLTDFLTEFNFTDLPNNIFPIFPITKYFKLNLLTKTLNLKRKQFPLIPNFSSTCYRIQGKTMDKICIDLSNTENKNIDCSFLYVSLSRLKSWNDLYVLREFDSEIFNKKPSQDLLKEIDRLKSIEKKTLLELEMKLV